MTTTMTHGEAAAALERMRSEDREARAAARASAAELAVLSVFDLHRAVLGHDYGGGQRRMETNRRERALEGDLVTLAYAAADVRLPESMIERAGEPLTAIELQAAWERVAEPRIRRVEREGYRRDTPGTRRTRKAWHHSRVWLDGRLKREEATR